MTSFFKDERRSLKESKQLASSSSESSNASIDRQPSNKEEDSSGGSSTGATLSPFRELGRSNMPSFGTLSLTSMLPFAASVISPREDSTIVSSPLSGWINRIGYPQLAYLFTDMMSLDQLSVEAIREQGITSSATAPRILQEAQRASTAVDSAPSSELPPHFNLKETEGFVWLQRLSSSSLYSTYLNVKKRKELSLCNKPHEIISKRVVRPLPAVTFSNHGDLAKTGQVKFTIHLLDDRRNVIEKGLTGQTTVEIESESHPTVSAVFEGLKIAVSSTSHYSSQRRPFYFAVTRNDEPTVYYSNAFYVPTHGEYFKRENLGLIHDVQMVQRTPGNMTLKLVGLFGSAPTFHWLAHITSKINKFPERDILIEPQNLLPTSVTFDLQGDVDGALLVQIHLRDREGHSVYSSEVKEFFPVEAMQTDGIVSTSLEPATEELGFGYNALTWKVGTGDVEGIFRLLSQEFDINQRDIDGRTPLFWAVWSGNYPVVQILLERGADVNIRDSLAFSCLHIASFNGSIDILDLLIKNGADVNARTIFNDCPLHYAGIKAHLQIVSALVHAGASVSMENEERETPIHWAQKSNISAIYEWLWSVSPLGQILSPYLSWQKLFLMKTVELTSSFINQTTIPPEFSKSLELEPLARFPDVKAEERLDLLLRKLRQCCATWHGSKASDNARSKSYKRQTLLELAEFVGHLNTIPEILYVEFTRMIALNLFRPLPARYNPPGVMYHPDEDEPILASDWVHVEIVYAILNLFVTSPAFDSKVGIRYMNQKFILQLLHLFDTEDNREREQLKVSLHRLYAAFLPHRTFIRTEIKNIFCTYVYETGQHNGIAELLEIVGSFAAGLSVPLKQEHKRYLVEALLPLYKGRLYSLYSVQLSYCILTFLEKDLSLAKLIFGTLLRFWPITNSQKVISFLCEVEELLNYYTNQTLQLQVFFISILKKIASCTASPHYQISERALLIFNSESILQFIATHIKRLLPIIFGALYDNKRHWHQSISQTSTKVLQLFKQIDTQLYNECKTTHLQMLRQIMQAQALPPS